MTWKQGNVQYFIGIGYEHNDAYTAYLHMGAPKQLTLEQVKLLNAAASGNPESVSEIDFRGGAFRTQMPLRSNDVWLVVLSPMSTRK